MDRLFTCKLQVNILGGEFLPTLWRRAFCAVVFLDLALFQGAARMIFRMEAPSPEPILQIGLGLWASKTLLSAVEMEVLRNWRDARWILILCEGGLACTSASSRSSFGS
jgi:hypothetical protein